MILFAKTVLTVFAICLSSAILFVFWAIVSALAPVAGRHHVGTVEGPSAFVCADAVHADFVFPLHNTSVDWPTALGIERWKELPQDTQVAIGWGDFEFFTKVPTWSDLTPAIAFSALSGRDTTALRVSPIRLRAGHPDCRQLELDAAGFNQIQAYILGSLSKTSDGQPILLSQSSNEQAYFKTEGSYGPFLTCNQWISEGLAKAELPHARFARLSVSG